MSYTFNLLLHHAVAIHFVLFMCIYIYMCVCMYVNMHVLP